MLIISEYRLLRAAAQPEARLSGLPRHARKDGHLRGSVPFEGPLHVLPAEFHFKDAEGGEGEGSPDLARKARNDGGAEFHPPGMEDIAACQGTASVLRVARERMAMMCSLGPDLVGPAGLEAHKDEAAASRTEKGQGRGEGQVAILGDRARQARLIPLEQVFPSFFCQKKAVHEGQVAFPDQTGPKGRRECARTLDGRGNGHDARCIPVKPVEGCGHERKRSLAFSPEAFPHEEVEAILSMCGHSAWLVHEEEILINL